MKNTLMLVQGDSRTVKRHVKDNVVRSFLLVINGVAIDGFRDDCQETYYYSGESLDRWIGLKLELYEKALGTKAERTSMVGDIHELRHKYFREFSDEHQILPRTPPPSV